MFSRRAQGVEQGTGSLGEKRICSRALQKLSKRFQGVLAAHELKFGV